MFGIIDTITDAVVDTVNVATTVGTLGILGSADIHTVKRLAIAGLTAYEIASMTGLATDVVMEALND